MDTPNGALLQTNGLLKIKKKRFYCMICITKRKTRDWESHIENFQHISLLERLNDVFENLGQQIFCKICKNFITLDMVPGHAKLHHITPWYLPADKFETFYDNHLTEFHRMYYCNLCDKMYAEWPSAYIHTEEKFHEYLRKQLPISARPISEKKMYSDLLSSGCTPGINDTIHCKMCNVNFGHDDITEHIADIAHGEKKLKLIENLSERAKKEGFVKETIDPKLYSHGMICNFVVQPNNPSKNEISVILKKSDKAVEMFDENWFSINFPKLNVNEPLCTKIAPLPVQSQNVELVDEPVDYYIGILDPLSKEVMGKNMKKHGDIVKKKQGFPDFCCLICCSLVPRTSSTDHLRGQRHAKNRRKYGCDNIFRTKDNEYYCKSCNYKMANFEDVYRHVTSKGHLDSIITAQMENGDVAAPSCPGKNPDSMPLGENATTSYQNSSSSRENSSPSCQDTTQSCQSLSCIFVVKRNAKKSYCHICDENPQIFTKNIKEHIASQRHIIALKRYGCENIVSREDATYICICCERDFKDLENVYLHIKDKKHMSSMIKVSVKEESRKKIPERSLTPEKMYQPPLGDNLLSDYIFQKIAPNSTEKIGSPILQASQCFENVHRSDYIGKRNNSIHSFNLMPNTQSDIAKHSSDSRNLISENYRITRPSLYDLIDAYTNDRSTDVDPVASEIQKQPELSSIVSSMANELTRLLEPFEGNKSARFFENERKSLTFNEKDKSREKKNYFWKDKILENNNNLRKIRCPICGISMSDLTQLHSHMAQHLSEEFVFNKRPGYRDSSSSERAIESSSTESQMITEVEDLFSQSEVMTNGNACIDNQLPVNGISAIETDASSNETKIVITKHENDKLFPPSETTPATFLNIDNPKKMQQYSPRRFDMRKVVQILNFDKDIIYEMTDKLADLRLGLKLCLVINSATIYCLVCRKTVTNAIKNYIEHLFSLDHCEYLEIMERDNALFEKTPDEFSDLDLAQEYMQEVNDNFVRCFICDKDIVNSDNMIEQHIYDKIHERTCEQMRANAMMNYNDLKSQIHCDWYSVQRYSCIPCEANMDCEVNFVKHLDSRKHALKLRNPENYGKKLIYDFCQHCALLWYGYRQTWSYHCEINTHKWLSRDCYFAMRELPKFAKNLLIESEVFIDEKIKYLDAISEAEAQKVETLIKDVENAAKLKFSKAKAYTFGSRISGLGSPESDIDIFVDCGNMYDGRESTEFQKLFFMNGVHERLRKDPQLWNVKELLTKCRSPIIRAFHSITGMACDLSFENGLAVENTKLIRTFNYVYPSCRKLILILKQWLAYCDLSGSDRITSYALYWYVIFYLQKESILPSVATLIAMKNKSQIIAGWETGVSHKFTYNEADGPLSIKELLVRFFKFYANFDFRFDVACPLLGDVVKKRDFANPWNLPDKMQPYIDYIKNSKKSESFRIDSAMCIQDPFDLQHNLTKAVDKRYLNRFRAYCSKSLDLLSSL